MKVKLHGKFEKAYHKLIAPYKKLSIKFDQRIELFKTNPQNPILHDHPLKGNKIGL